MAAQVQVTQAVRRPSRQRAATHHPLSQIAVLCGMLVPQQQQRTQHGTSCRTAGRCRIAGAEGRLLGAPAACAK